MKACTYILFMAVLCQFSMAQEKFYVSAHSTAQVNQPFKISFVLENASGNQFKAPQFEGFNVVGGPNQSTSIQYINGRMSQSLTISYWLNPTAVGTETIGSASIQVNNKTLITDPIDITIQGGGESSAQEGNQSEKQNTSQSIEQQLAENMFVRLILDKKKAYVGEQITATLKLYYRVNYNNAHITEMPQFNGFWKQEIEVSNEQTTETYNGKEFYTQVIGKYALFPQRSGELTISPIKIQAEVKLKNQNRDPFDFFNWDPWKNPFPNMYQIETKAHAFQSTPTTIKVESLPENRPSHFSGLVGKFSVETSLDKSSIDVNDAITYNIKISGTGNVMSIKEPSVEWPRSFEVYDPQPNESVSRKSTYVNGFKSYDFLIIPSLPGEYTIPPFELSYFDPASKTYQSISSDSYSINVQGEHVATATSTHTSIYKEEVALLDEDIRYIHTHLSGGKISTYWPVPLYLGLYSGPVFLFAFLLVYKRNRQQIDTAKRRYTRAAKVAQKKLTRLKRYIQAEDKALFFSNLSKILWEYGADKINIRNATLSKDVIAEGYKKKGVSIESIEQYIAILDQCEFAAYAGSTDAASLETIYKKAIELIATIEHESK